jgi:ABC-type uncharacterized transport system ATPase subunit
LSTERALRYRPAGDLPPETNFISVDKQTPGSEQDYRVEMMGVSKRFGTLLANERVDLHVRTGTLHAIVGENGAGKTTLMRVLYGYYLPDEGEIRLQGRPVRFRTPADAIDHHIGMVSQHYSIIPELTALDNLMLGSEVAGRFGVLDRREALQRAQKLAASVDFDPLWSQSASELTPAEKQKLEILKLLWRNAELLILDEPTAMLSPSDTENLFATLARLKNEGRTILLVTHKLREVMEYADHVTILRGGRKIAESPVAQTDVETITGWIVGESGAETGMRDVSNAEFGTPNPELQTPNIKTDTEILKMVSLFVRGDRGGWGLQSFSLELQAGEILGVAGVDGNGQVELIEALAGLRAVSQGQLFLSGQSIARWSPQRRMQAGMRFLFEDRFRRGMIPQWSVQENAILGAQREPTLQRVGWFQMEAVRKRAGELVQRFGVKTGSLQSPMVSLSGGNQQRLVVARALYGKPQLLIAYAPTRGLDIRGIEATYHAIRHACRQGMAALVLSLDLEELMIHCDRIGTLYRGQLTRFFTPDGYSREKIGAYMVGVGE